VSSLEPQNPPPNFASGQAPAGTAPANAPSFQAPPPIGYSAPAAPVYPQAPGVPPAVPAQATYPPPPNQVPGFPGAVSSVYPAANGVQLGEEAVGRGLLFAVGGVLLGVILNVALWQGGYIASIASFAMAWACLWLYAKGAGRAPQKGLIPVIALIGVGVVISLLAVFASDAVRLTSKYIYDPSLSDYLSAIGLVLTSPEVWLENAGTVFMFFLFAALGSVGTIVRLAKAKKV
jgi:hypothetical protein